MITLLFFGRLSDASDRRHMALPDGVNDTDSLLNWLADDDADLGAALARSGNRVAVNAVFVTDNTPIKDGDEIAFMSPLSGG